MSAGPRPDGGRDDATGPVTLGIDVGGTKILGLAVDGSGSVLAEAKAPTPRVLAPGSTPGAGGDAVIEAVAGVAEQLIEALDTAGRVVTAAGVGVPGMVDDAGVLRFAPNLPGGEGLDVGGRVTTRLGGLRVVVDNDATCAAVAEWTSGAAVGASDAVVVTLGTGIGGGLVVDNRVARGALGFAGEIGHMVVDPSGPSCPCGKRGCWERFASGSGLGRLAREAAHAGRLDAVLRLAGGDPEAVRAEDVTAAAATGDAGARAVLEELAWWLALGLANLANILDPSVFVLGGGLVDALDLVIEPVRVAFDDLVEGRLGRPEVMIRLATLGERAGAVGAGLLARQDHRSLPGRPG
ncbi:MAG TPA: ROK family protein [Acidimicrobiales bacterium]|nr:ROK family protein [Acidimicrobiales bacterium]